MDYINFPKKYSLRFVISAILIGLPFFPLLIFDLLAEIYHHFSFPIYGLQKVKRSEYIAVKDRGRLKYLTWYQKLACMYCGYINGALPYFAEIASRTEKYWCGIMQPEKPGFKIQKYQIEQDFSKFGDKEDFDQKYIKKTLK